jgi:hypothetical protein
MPLSHVALPFPPDDPHYGDTLPKQNNFVFLGNLAFRGERGLLKIPTDWLLRMCYNPYEYLENRLLQWLETAELGMGISRDFTHNSGYAHTYDVLTLYGSNAGQLISKSQKLNHKTTALPRSRYQSTETEKLP